MRAVLILLILSALVAVATQPWDRSASRREAGAEIALLESGEALESSGGAAAVDSSERIAEDADQRLSGGFLNEDRRESEDTPVAATPPKSVFYQWVDERGSVHFAASLDEVPADWRSRAGQIQLDSAAFNQTASPAAMPARPRRIVDTAPTRRAHDVTVYTAPWCGWCRKTLAFLDQLGVDYVNKDIEEDAAYAAELREKTGGNAIPLVEIDGNAIRGFDPGRMVVLLD